MKEKGFSLIEILMTSLIFMIFVLAIFNSMFYSYKNIIASRNAEISINLCQEEMEMIKKFPYGSITCPAIFTPNPYPVGDFPPVMYPTTYPTCVSTDSAKCTLTEPPHDHKDLLVYVGSNLGTQTTNGTKTITVQWVDDPKTTQTQDYKKITVTIKWQEGGKERTREISSYICEK